MCLFTFWQFCNSNRTSEQTEEDWKAASQGAHTWTGVYAPRGDVNQKDQEVALYTSYGQGSRMAGFDYG